MSCNGVYHSKCVSAETVAGLNATLPWMCDKCVETGASGSASKGVANKAAAALDSAETHRASKTGVASTHNSDPSPNTTQNMSAETGVLTNNMQFMLIMEEFKGIRAAINVNNENISSNNQLIREQKDLLLGCMDNIETLKLENADLRIKVNELEGKIQNMSANSIYSEVRDRMQRETNVIISGVKENSGIEDTTVVEDMMGKIAGISADQILSVSRIGRAEAGQDKLLLVKLRDLQSKIRVLQNKSKLEKAGYSKVVVRSDMTFTQRRDVAKLRQEVADRKNAGETNIYVGYSKGEPVIRTSNTKRAKRSREEDISPKRDQGLKMPNTDDALGGAAL